MPKLQTPHGKMQSFSVFNNRADISWLKNASYKVLLLTRRLFPPQTQVWGTQTHTFWLTNENNQSLQKYGNEGCWFHSLKSTPEKILYVNDKSFS